MKKFGFMFIFAFIAAFLISCGSGEKEGTQEGEKPIENTGAVIESDTVGSNEAEEANATEGEKPLNILFVGNSLIQWSGMHQQLEQLCKSNGKDVTVGIQWIPYASLIDNFEPLKQNPEMTENADIVIFNAAYSDDQIILVRDFEALFPEKTQFYMLYTEYDNLGTTATFYSEVDNLKFVPSGLAHDLLIKKGILTYRQLHMDNDFHPNFLYGYVAALAVYGEIYGEKCEDMVITMSTGNVSMIPGKTEEERKQRLNDILATVDEAVAADLYQVEADRNLAVIANDAEAVTNDALTRVFNIEVMDEWGLKKSEIVSLGTEKIRDDEYLVAVGYKTNDTNAEYDWLYLITMLYYKFDGEAARIEPIERYYLPHKLTAESEEFKSDLVTTPQIHIDINEVNAAGESLSSYYINFIFDETALQFGAGKVMEGAPENPDDAFRFNFEIYID